MPFIMIILNECVLINIMSLQKDKDYTIYSIGTKQQQYSIKKIDDSSEIYNVGSSCRRARLTPPLPFDYDKNQPFTDHRFPPNIYKGQAQAKHTGGIRRIYELYDEQFDLFEADYYQPSDVQLDEDRTYQLPTFLSQFSMIDREYIKTRFITRRMNRAGYYEYFIRRDGEYYVDYIDDFIPTVGVKQYPLWGLNIKEPWKLIIMKAWIKEKGSIKAVEEAEPYEFIEAFGVAGYRALSIKKEVEHVHKSRLSQEAMAQRQKQRTKLNVPGFITVGKTRNNQKVALMGLRKNRAGYKIIPIEQKDKSSGLKVANGVITDTTIFKVQSELPVYWVGDYSIASSKLLTSYNPNAHKLNIEKEFLASYSEISNIFSKFYITPQYTSHYYLGNVIEDSIKIEIDSKAVGSHYFFELDVATKGSININVDLPHHSGEKVQGHSSLRYAPIKYFLTKIAQKSDGKFTTHQFYDGQYVKGYHKSLNRFLQISQGKYLIYVKIQNEVQRKAKFFTINLMTNSKISKFQLRDEKPVDEEAQIIKSTFFGYAKAHGIRCYIHKTYKDLVIYICNKFDEIGFAFIALYCHPNAKGLLALKAHHDELKKHKIAICKQAHQAYGDVYQPTKLIAKPGEPEMLVLQRTERLKSKDENFPPLNTIEFYEIL